MSEQQAERLSPDDDIHNRDLAAVETEYPILNGLFPITITDIYDEERNGTRRRVFEFQLESEGTTVTGGTVPIGRKLSTSISLTTTDKNTDSAINERLAKAQAGILGTKKAVNNVPWSSLVSKKTWGKFSARNGTSRDGTPRVFQNVDFVGGTGANGTVNPF